MLPVIRRLDNIEMIRDGGSLSATFESDAGSRYILFFQFDMEQLSVGKTRYLAPILIDCDPTMRPANTDNIVYSELGGPSIPISWSQARDVLATIVPLATSLSPSETKWLEIMINAAATDGQMG